MRSRCDLQIVEVFVYCCVCATNNQLVYFGGSVVPMVKKRAKPVRTRFLSMRPHSKPGPGRPPVHSETWSEVSVVLFDRQSKHLDRLATDGRGKHGKALNRAEIIRALIDGLIDSGIDVLQSPSEAELRAIVARRLGTPYR